MSQTEMPQPSAAASNMASPLVQIGSATATEVEKGYLRQLDGASEAAPRAGENLIGFRLEDLQALCQELGEPKFRALQIFEGLMNHRRQRFEDLTNLSKALRAKLSANYSIARPTIAETQVSTDGTRKYRFVATDGAAFEAVYIPTVAKGSNTNTLCISSQTGCAIGCKFCYTASLKRNRNLHAAEIVGQVLAVRDDVAPLGEHAKVTNIVFMGMGEPLLNYDNLVQAIKILTHEKGCDFSTRRVTVSTSGIVPRIYDLGRDVNTQLAISLNATTDAIRTEVMPINKKWPLERLVQAMRDYPLLNRRRITVEYVMLGGINDSLEDARRLPKLLAGIPVKLNLLPLNDHDRTPYSPPEPAQVQRFQAELKRLGMHAIMRTPRGQDIAAACGQLGESVVRPAASGA